MILDEILAHKRAELEARKAHEPRSSVVARALSSAPPIDFREALSRPQVAIIAEIKRASPARGDLRIDLDAAATAVGYVEAGAAAISVLTDERYFRGSDADLLAVRAAVRVPLLRKDFIVDGYQVYEARALGADAVLLIVRALSRGELANLAEIAAGLGMASLVEVHTETELSTAIEMGASLIGINNRDLSRMVVDIDTTARLLPLVPRGVTVVSESGIKTADDVRLLGALGVHCLLVGEALMAAPDPFERLRELQAAASPAAQAVSRR